MSKIISSKDAKKYKIEKFEFGQGREHIVEKTTISDIFSKPKEFKKDEIKEEKVQKQDCSELLQKVDALSSEVVTLQMELENQKKEFEKKLEERSQEAYKNGMQEASQNMQQEIEELKVQYISSITSLQELEIDIKDKLSKFEEELIETSIIIATKVIKKEVEESSSTIAKSIAKYLLSDIKDELEIKLLVNPVDYEELLKENLRENIKIISDGSIKMGGVVLLSRDKNLDGTIETRFKKTLQLIKES